MTQIFRARVHEPGFFPPAGPVAPALALASTVLGSALSVAQQAQQGAAQAGLADYQAQLARNSQRVAEDFARRAEQQGRVDEQQQRLKSASLLGAQRAALAGQGGDVNSGSPLDLQVDTARAGEVDARTVRSNAALRAYGYRLQANDAAAEAGRHDAAAANIRSTLGTSLLGGATSIVDRWPRGWRV